MSKHRSPSVCPFVGICALLLSLCSCATPGFVHPPLPAPIAFNSNAGRGDWIKVKLRLENGDEISPVVVDTGWPYRTVLDKSLEPLLGKRLGSKTIYSPFLGLVKVDVYKAPKVYLGGMPLLMGSRINVCDLQKKASGLKGILGVDCLRHYCVQFDFSREEMRFLDPNAPDSRDFGRAIPLTIIGGLVIARADCFGTGKIFFCPDTGCQLCDAMLKARLIRKLSKKQNCAWSGTFPGLKNRPKMAVGFKKGMFAGETYADLTFMEWVGSWPHSELLGLPFLARNLVTFDFPRRTMYLKKENAGPQYPNFYITEEARNYLANLAGKGELPGWATNESGGGGWFDGPTSFTNYPISLTLNIHKDRAPGWIDVTAKVKSIASARPRQILAANAMAGYDPAPNQTKQLRVTVRTGRHNRTSEIAEGRTFTLPVGADILQARYGYLAGRQVNPGPADGDNSIYHYTLVRGSPNEVWKLTKAWHTDAKGGVIGSYPVDP